MTTVSRFWRLAGLIVLANFLLIGLVLLSGDRRDVLPDRIDPTDGGQDVSTRPTIRIAYRRPIDPASLRAAVRIEPPIAGEPEVTATGLTLVPARALRPDTAYSIDIAAGVREAGTGKVSQLELHARFRTRPSRLVVRRQDGDSTEAWGLDPETGRSWQITAGAITDLDHTVSPMAPSPDGERLAYAVFDTATTFTLWVANLDGSNRRPIVHLDYSQMRSMAWSPRGDLLAFESRDVNGTIFGRPGDMSNPRIWLTQLDGQLPALAYGRGVQTATNPVWSPDGRRLAFYDKGYQAIAIFDFTRAVTLLPSKGGSSGTWAADGQTLAYVDRVDAKDARSTVKVAAVQAGARGGRSITPDGSSDRDPAWSPSGDWIALVRRDETGRTGIWLARPDGSEARPLQRDAGWDYGPPVWSPDGTALAFSRSRPGVAPAVGAEIWISTPDQAPRRLSAVGAVVAWAP